MFLLINLCFYQEWKSGRTGLHLAVESGNKSLYEVLITHKADPTTRTYAGHTAYRYARMYPTFQGTFVGLQDDSDYSSSEDEDEDSDLQVCMHLYKYMHHVEIQFGPGS